MSSRRPMYLIGVGLLAVLFSALQVIVAGVVAVETYRTKRFAFAPIPGVTEKTTMNPLAHLPMWRDKLVHAGEFKVLASGNGRGPNTVESKIVLIDPETGSRDVLGPTFVSNGHAATRVFGDRLWKVDRNAACEFVEGVLKPTAWIGFSRTFNDSQELLWNGQPASIESTKNGLEVSLFSNGKWKSIGVVSGSQALPNEWSSDGSGGSFGVGSTPQVIESASGLHLFVHSNGRILYHKGLEVDSIPVKGEDSQVSDAGTAGALQSLIEPTLVQGDSTFRREDWLLVCEHPTDRPLYGLGTHGIMIDGKPGALIIRGSNEGRPVAHVYCLDGATWIELAASPLPFGVCSFVVATTRDGQRSYVGMRTSLSTSYFYAIDATGLHETAGSAIEKTTGSESGMSNQASMSMIIYGCVFAIPLVLGMFLAAGVGMLMFVFTVPVYSFGLDTVKLASVMKRGIARVIDIALIVATAAALICIRGWTVNWLDVAEALNQRLDHPSIPIALRAISSGVTCAMVWIILLLITQSTWGVTPGKWLCGLRTMKTSLRPCGFSASLAREIVLFVDCCNFCCWSPGIVSIALTNQRQRLGDLVADTIVVELSSLTNMRSDSLTATRIVAT